MSTIEKILDLLKQKGMSQKDFVKEFGLAKNIVSEWKNGRIKPSLDMIAEIAKYFNISSDWLLNLSDDPTPPNKKEPAPELYPGQAEILTKAQKLLEQLSIEDLEVILKIAKSLNNPQSDK